MNRVQVTPRSYPTNLIDKDWGNRKLFYTKDSENFLRLVHDMKLRDDDVWIVTLPKCGTTWMQELLWLLLNNCDFEGALAKDQELRTPFLEWVYPYSWAYIHMYILKPPCLSGSVTLFFTT